MGTLTYEIELPDENGDIVYHDIELEYSCEETDDGTAHDYIAPRSLYIFELEAIHSSNPQVEAFARMMLKDDGDFAEAVHKYISNNAEV